MHIPGIFPQDIINHKLWWSGPEWLKSEPDKWPKLENQNLNISNIPELKTNAPNNVLITSSSQIEDNCNFITRFSSWNKLKRTTAFVLRFIHNTRHASLKRTGNLTSDELKQSEITICRIVQQQEFSSEFETLKKNKTSSNKLKHLSPFVDENNLIRVGGRLKNADISLHAKHPILMSKSHHISSLIVDFYHHKYLHAGPQLLQSLITQQF